MIGVVSFQVTTVVAALASVGCAGRVEHRTTHSFDGKTTKPLAEDVIDALLFGRRDGKAIKKLHPLFFSFPGHGIRVFRDKRGNIVRVEDATDTKPLTRKQHSDPQGIELHAIGFMNSNGARPANR